MHLCIQLLVLCLWNHSLSGGSDFRKMPDFVPVCWVVIDWALTGHIVVAQVENENKTRYLNHHFFCRHLVLGALGSMRTFWTPLCFSLFFSWVCVCVFFFIFLLLLFCVVLFCCFICCCSWFLAVVFYSCYFSCFSCYCCYSWLLVVDCVVAVVVVLVVFVLVIVFLGRVVVVAAHLTLAFIWVLLVSFLFFLCFGFPQDAPKHHFPCTFKGIFPSLSQNHFLQNPSFCLCLLSLIVLFFFFIFLLFSPLSFLFFSLSLVLCQSLFK